MADPPLQGTLGSRSPMTATAGGLGGFSHSSIALQKHCKSGGKNYSRFKQYYTHLLLTLLHLLLKLLAGGNLFSFTVEYIVHRICVILYSFRHKGGTKYQNNEKIPDP